MEIKWRVVSGKGEGKNGGKVQGIRSRIGRHKIDRGDVKNSIGNGEAKRQLTCTTMDTNCGE